MQCDYYVYVHKKKSDNSVFYVGKGRLIRESISHKRTQAWKEAAKDGWYSEKLHENLSNKDAITLENMYLKENNWILVNVAAARQVNTISYAEVSFCLKYDRDSPSCLSWVNTDGKRNIKKSGFAGYKDPQGYHSVRLNKKLYAAHRLVWVLFHKEISENMIINHIDHCKHNNKIENLELVTEAINGRRTITQKNKYSGIVYSSNTLQGAWIAYWHDLNSKRQCKSFNCKHYADAKEKAYEYRRERLIELNAQGAGYVLE